MNISEPVEKSVLSAKAKDILLNKGIVTIGELFSAKGKQFSEIINENSDIAKELEGFIRRNAEQAERAGISIDYVLSATQNAKSGKPRDKPKLSGINQHKADCYAVCCVSQVVYPARCSKVSCQKNRCKNAPIFYIC